MTDIHPFDLQARAEMAVSALTGLLDPERQGLMYFLANWRARPPRADHGLWDCGDGSGRHVDALTLARAMVRRGSPAALSGQADAQLERWMLRLIGPEGLSWLPAEPWAEPWGRDVLLAGYRPGELYAEVSWAQRGTLMGLTTRYLRTGDEQYLDVARRLVDGLQRVAVEHPDGLYFPEGYYGQSGWGREAPGLYPGLEEYNAVIVQPAVRLYEACGYEPALELAEKVFRFALKHTATYLPDGSFRRVTPGQPEAAHFHTHTCFAAGALKLGLALGRREYVAWAWQTYEHAKTWGTDFGWFPEGLGARHGEICATTDMIELALLLGQHVDRRYYADAERFGRNHLLQSQWLSLDRLQKALDRLPPDPEPAPWHGRFSTTERVAERQVGGFASRPTLNDAFHLDATGLMQCCNAAGTRALYDLWRYALEVKRASGSERPEVSVHLRFSVEDPLIRVVSHEPGEGRLCVCTREDCVIAVRLPEGAPGAVLVSAGRVQAVRAVDGYVRFVLSAGQTADLYYPLCERTAWYEVGAGHKRLQCAARWRGEAVIGVEPSGTFYPLYEAVAEVGAAEPGPPAGPMVASL